MQGVSLQEEHVSPYQSPGNIAPDLPIVPNLPPPEAAKRAVFDLPAPDSEEWEATSLPPPRTPANKGKTPKKTR